MRNWNKQYNIIFCDIDSTLVYGPMTRLMHHSWNLLHSDKFSAMLMFLQDRFNLFRVNKTLQYILNNYFGRLVFITVRKHNPATRRMIEKILPNKSFELFELATDDAANAKLFTAMDIMFDNMFENHEVCMIDDSDSVREAFRRMEIDAFDPVAMYEEFIA